MLEVGQRIIFRERARAWRAAQSSILTTTICADSRGLWDDYNSPMDSIASLVPGHDRKSFGAYFWPVLDGCPSLKIYLRKRLAHKSGQAIGIEFGGPASSLFASCVPLFKRSLGIVLFDLRKRSDNTGLSIVEDNRINHRIIEGDMLQDGTFEKVTEWLNGEKADFIIERLSGPIGVLSHNPFYLGQKIEQVYQILEEGGVILAQCPFLPFELMEAWRRKVMSEAEPGSLELAIAPQGADYVLRIGKNRNAPQRFPLLSARETLAFYRRS